jgi:hypothetical protein
MSKEDKLLDYAAKAKVHAELVGTCAKHLGKERIRREMQA